MFIFDLQSKFRMGLGSFAEGQRSLPHPRRFPEDGRSTASLPRVKIQDGVAHAIANWREVRFRHPLTAILLPKGHKCGGDTIKDLRIVKKKLKRQGLRRAPAEPPDPIVRQIPARFVPQSRIRAAPGVRRSSARGRTGGEVRPQPTPRFAKTVSRFATTPRIPASKTGPHRVPDPAPAHSSTLLIYRACQMETGRTSGFAVANPLSMHQQGACG